MFRHRMRLVGDRGAEVLTASVTSPDFLKAVRRELSWLSQERLLGLRLSVCYAAY